jgi:hypothetical protein
MSKLVLKSSVDGRAVLMSRSGLISSLWPFFLLNMRKGLEDSDSIDGRTLSGSSLPFFLFRKTFILIGLGANSARFAKSL